MCSKESNSIIQLYKTFKKKFKNNKKQTEPQAVESYLLI